MMDVKIENRTPFMLNRWDESLSKPDYALEYVRQVSVTKPHLLVNTIIEVLYANLQNHHLPFYVILPYVRQFKPVEMDQIIQALQMSNFIDSDGNIAGLIHTLYEFKQTKLLGRKISRVSLRISYQNNGTRELPFLESTQA